MFSFSDTEIKDLALHHVGNQFHEELLVLGSNPLTYSDDVESDLLTYFFSSFKTDEFYNFHHETDLSLNEVFHYVSKVFDNPGSLNEHSKSLAKHLYEHSTHPKVKGGEFYVVYFKDCTLEGEIVDAVGLFKAENKDTFLNVRSSDNGFQIASQQGFHINKLDKGCLVFNTERESGYVVAVVDNTNKGSDAKFWLDHFLQVTQRNDEYFQTENLISFTKEYITKALPNQFEASKADQIHLLNKTSDYLKEQDEFDLSEYAQTVLEQPEIIDDFNAYKSSYAKDRAVVIEENFQISEAAVKKKNRVFKSVIKLDKNFHVYVHGNRDMIERHEDEDGRKYYKLYYNEET